MYLKSVFLSLPEFMLLQMAYISRGGSRNTVRYSLIDKISMGGNSIRSWWRKYSPHVCVEHQAEFRGLDYHKSRVGWSSGQDMFRQSELQQWSRNINRLWCLLEDQQIDHRRC